MIEAREVILYRMVYMLYSGYVPAKDSLNWWLGMHAPNSAVYIGF